MQDDTSFNERMQDKNYFQSQVRDLLILTSRMMDNF